MEKPSPTWQHLPLFFKRNVVENLDFSSRFNLSLSSQSDQCLVHSCSFNYHSMFIALPNKKYSEYTIGTQETRKSEMSYVDFKKENGMKALISSMKHSKSKIEELTIEFNSEKDDQKESIETMTKFGEELRSAMETNKIELIKIGNLTIDFTFGTRGPLHKVLTCFDPKILFELRVLNGINQETLNEIRETEQWKRLKKFTLNGTHSVPILELFPPECMFFEARGMENMILTPDDVRNVVERYLTKNAPFGAFFLITTRFHEFDMDETINNLRVNSYEVTWDESYTDLKFKMEDPKNVFVARIFELGAQGAVCTRDNLENDIEWLLRI